jgi:FkbM family methyltransferase
MTTLHQAHSTHFTDWVVKNDILQSPFVLCDVGCKDGIHPRFDPLSPVMVAHGFDPIDEEIRELASHNARPNVHYHAMALGDEDGEREFFVSANRAQSSFYFSVSPAELERQRKSAGDAADGVRRVPVRRLDTLVAEGRMPVPDYIKMDVEGHEPHVIAGGKRTIGSGRVLAIESESGFTADRGQPDCHFATISKPIHELGLRFHSLGYWHSTKACMAGGHLLPNGNRFASRPIGRIQGLDALFVRDLIADWHDAVATAPEGQSLRDTVTKACLLLELFNLNDCAIELMQRVRTDTRLRSVIGYDPDEAIDRLLPDLNGLRLDFETYQRIVEMRAKGLDPTFKVVSGNRIVLD